MTDASNRYLLVKRGLYWRANAQGYTGLKGEAGVYSDAESLAYGDTCSTDQTYRILAADADDLAPACSDAERALHWQQRAEVAEARGLPAQTSDLLAALQQVRAICMDENEDDHVAHILEVASAALPPATDQQ